MSRIRDPWRAAATVAAVAAALAAIAVASAAVAQTAASGPWFGVPAPGPATEQVLDFKASDLPMIPAPSVRDAPELDGRKVHKYLEDVVDFSYQSRAAGERETRITI